jgi:anti-anti-sigma factor
MVEGRVEMQDLVPIGHAEIGLVNGRPTIRGDCDVANAATIGCWLATFGESVIDVDLSGVTFFDAATLRAVLVASRRNPNMRVVTPSAIVRRVLLITGTAHLCLPDKKV